MQSTSENKNSALPTLVFIHGGCHTPQYFDKVIPPLESKGFRCLAPQMLFCGTTEPLKTLTPCVQQVSELIEAETAAGRNVVMVNHSVGGLSGSSGVRGFTKKNPSRLRNQTGATQGYVIGMVLVSAIITTSEGPLKDILAAMAANIGVDEAGWLTPAGPPKDLFYNDLPDEEAELWISRLVNQSPAMPASDEDVYAGWLDVPRWYVICEKDQAVPVSVQEAFISGAKSMGAKGEERRIDSGHFPFISKPRDVVKIIEEAVTSFTNQ